METNKNEVSIKIKKLSEKLDFWALEYYKNDNPSVTDAEYDGVYNTLVELEKEFPELALQNSITKRVGSDIDNRFKKVKHNFQMLSLSNAFNEDDIKDFNKKIIKEIGDSKLKYVTELKIDGLSISIHYKGGKLTQALTRGDGITGEDVTHNVLNIKDVPNEIEYKKDLEVRGEIYIKLDDFETLKDKFGFANPRNAAAGSMRQLDANISKERNLSSFIYMIPNPLDHGFKTHKETLEFIKECGFATNDKTVFHNNINSVIEQIEVITNFKENLNYQIDGIVIKVDQVDLYEDIGYTSKFPKYMTAFKFPEELVITELEDIFVTIGRTGRVTYNAKLSPVRLGGTTVTAATLHNSDYINKLGINIGDRVHVKKAGEIIPKVVSVFEKKNNEKWAEATTCPSCKEALSRTEGEVDQYCLNKECDWVKQAKIEHFVSRTAMNIVGVSSEIIRTFIKAGFIKDISDLYKLKEHKEEIIGMPGFKTKSVTKILSSIEESRTQDLDKFIFGLGIRHVGAKNAKIISKRFGSLKVISNL